MGTNLMRALLLTSASVAMVATAAPTAAYAQEATYQIDIPAQSMGDALRALGKATKQNIVFNGSLVKGKRSTAVRGRMSASEALDRILQGSGLKMSRGAGGGLVVAQGGNGAVEQGRVESPGSVIAAPSATASTIVDARTGAALKGALVEIVETGEKASTGDLGDFRFPGKNGSYNLRISYLGYPPFEQFVDLRDGRATTGILLSDGSASSEIIVTAYQSGRAQALNQERTAENVSTVISADLLGQFDGTTISDSLRRAPGVAFQFNEKTGEGSNIVVRGLGPEFNTVTLNGVRLPVGNGLDRSPALNNLLTDSISKVTLNKTLLPNQDGSGTGALVEIETKGALDRPRRSFTVGVEGATVPNNFLDEFIVSGNASAKFGASENFGVSASVQYRKRNITRLGVNGGPVIGGQYLPATDGPRTVNNLLQIDGSRLFPFEEGVDAIYPSSYSTAVQDTRLRDLSIVLGAQWRIGDHTTLRLDYNRAEQKSDSFISSYTVNAWTDYVRLPIDDLGGEVRAAYVWEGASPFGPGMQASVNHFASGDYGAKTKTDLVSFQGSSDFGRLSLKYRAGYTIGRTTNPNTFALALYPIGGFITFDRSHLQQAALENTVAGRIVSPFASLSSSPYPIALFNDAGYSLVNDPNRYTMGYTSLNGVFGKNRRYSADFSARYETGSKVLEYIEGGLFWERSRNSADTNSGAQYDATTYGRPISDYGLSLGSPTLALIGIDGGFRTIARGDVDRFFKSLPSLSSGASPLFSKNIYDPAPLEDQNYTEEDNLAAFLQAKINIGKLEVIGGVRYEKVRTNAASINSIYVFDANSQLDMQFYLDNLKIINTFGNQSDFLPRVTANYRFNESLIARMGYYRTIARPSINKLNSSESIYLYQRRNNGPARNQPKLSIVTGNPDLDPAYTDNFDISFEMYTRDVGSIKAGAFYKVTKNLPYTVAVMSFDAIGNTVLPDDPRFQNLPADIFIQRDTPSNDPYKSKIWGLEFSAERRFTFLPGALSGLGMYGNYTYTKGSRATRYYNNVTRLYVVSPGAPYYSQPEHSGTVALTYGRNGIDASLAYTYQAEYATLDYTTGYGLTNKTSSFETLDLRVAYRMKILGSDTRIYFEGSNLLKGRADPGNTLAVGSLKTDINATYSASFYGGRSFRFGISSTF